MDLTPVASDIGFWWALYVRAYRRDRAIKLKQYGGPTLLPRGSTDIWVHAWPVFPTELTEVNVRFVVPVGVRWFFRDAPRTSIEVADVVVLPRPGESIEDCRSEDDECGGRDLKWRNGLKRGPRRPLDLKVTVNVRCFLLRLELVTVARPTRLALTVG